jgi:site-specific DNA-methyltransferase (adenine-specific)
VTPYYEHGGVTLYHGDCRQVLPQLDQPADSCVTDPPYGETVAAWDQWPAGWVKVVGVAVPSDASLWCFGSARMFLEHVAEFSGWRYAQEQLWLKRNGSGPGSRDRLVKIHEWAYHWYRGRWSAIYHEWDRERTDANRGTARKQSRSAGHQRDGRATSWSDDGTRTRRSVVEAPSIRYQRRHQDEKPLAVVAPLVQECTPSGGLVLDPFAGTGTTGLAARLLGRRAVLIEADEATCEVAALRLDQGSLVAEVLE